MQHALAVLAAAGVPALEAGSDGAATNPLLDVHAWLHATLPAPCAAFTTADSIPAAAVPLLALGPAASSFFFAHLPPSGFASAAQFCDETKCLLPCVVYAPPGSGAQATVRIWMGDRLVQHFLVAPLSRLLAWAVPSDAALAQLAALGPILEVRRADLAGGPRGRTSRADLADGLRGRTLRADLAGGPRAPAEAVGCAAAPSHGRGPAPRAAGGRRHRLLGPAAAGAGRGRCGHG